MVRKFCLWNVKGSSVCIISLSQFNTTWYTKLYNALCLSMYLYMYRFDSVFIMEYPDDLNPKNMITKYISYVDNLLIQCLQVSLVIRCHYHFIIQQ